MEALRIRPPTIHHKRFARNGSVPDANYVREIVGAQNHIMKFARKVVFRSGSNFLTGTDSGASRIDNARWRFHSGYGASRMVVRVMFGLDCSSSATDPRVSISIDIAGVGIPTLYDLRSGAVSISGTTTNSPSLCGIRDIRIPISANTSYEVRIHSDSSGGRPLSILAWEESDVDASVDYYHELQPGVSSPIYDSTRQRTLQGLSNIWRRNGAHLLNYSDCDTSNASVYTSATWVNVIDPLLSTVTPTSPGYFLGDEDKRLSYMCRLSSNNTLNVVLAAYASVNNSASTGEVRLQDEHGTLCSLTGMGPTAQWYSTTTTISNCDRIRKVDLQARTSNAANTLTLRAVSLYTYLA